eukprot:10377251-Ditylum_brightwellii.AAC.1
MHLKKEEEDMVRGSHSVVKWQRGDEFGGQCGRCTKSPLAKDNESVEPYCLNNCGRNDSLIPTGKTNSME